METEVINSSAKLNKIPDLFIVLDNLGDLFQPQW